MILSGKEIHRQIGLGNILITPYDEKLLGPNSCNLRLHNELWVYTDPILDMKKPLSTKPITIPEEGLVLEPGVLYLGRTHEYTATDKYAPQLSGRSSIGRIGLYVHVTAGFGDIGFRGYWTLEIECIQPVRIYPMVEICQICYYEVQGDYSLYEGKYRDNSGIQASLIHKDFLYV
ncbi:MAG: dCTP deaminase [Oscillospiraceae bacterium]|nr:dCTP deaminase [Oscillospiraceae bacterium]